MIQVCPERDAVCPHGYPCPYAIDRYECKPEGLPQPQGPRDSAPNPMRAALEAAEKSLAAALAPFKPLTSKAEAEDALAKVRAALASSPPAVGGSQERVCGHTQPFTTDSGKPSGSVSASVAGLVEKLEDVHAALLDFPSRSIVDNKLSGVDSRKLDWIEDVVKRAAARLESLAREVGEKDHIVALARELVGPKGMVNRGVDRGLVVIEKADKSDPHYRLCTALDALTPQPATGGSDTLRMNQNPSAEGEGCHADRDGDCSAPTCPQLRDGEPAASGRHCPLDMKEEE